MISFTIETKKIQVWPSKDANRPVIYFNTFSEEGEQVLSLLKDNSDMTEKNHDFTLAAISNLDWDHDMSPWDIPPIFKGDTPCTGGANDYLNLLTKKILPEKENHIKVQIMRYLLLSIYRNIYRYFFAIEVCPEATLFEGGNPFIPTINNCDIITSLF